MARCVKCNGTWRIPLDHESSSLDEDRADRIAIEVLEQEGDDDGTVVMESMPNGGSREDRRSVLGEVDAQVQAEEDPPDIGDESTPPEVKELRRERHRLLLEIGRQANEQILSTALNAFQARIKKIEKHIRRQRAWLTAVDRASDANPVTRRMEVSIDYSAAGRQLAKLEKDRDYALRVLAEALIRSGQNPEVCPHQRERIKSIDARLAILVPLIQPKKKGLLSLFRRG